MSSPNEALRRHAPATDRNREAILAVLREVLPTEGLVLEIASGTGQHAAFFAGELAGIEWQPTDPDAPSRASIDAWTAEISNVRRVIELDVLCSPWPIARADAIVCINMIHIAPWSACEALMRGAASLLAKGAPLCLYGPYRRGGAHTAPSNEAFDRGLRERNPAWGVRDLEEVVRVAGECGFTLERVVEMPANNLSVILVRGVK